MRRAERGRERKRERKKERDLFSSDAALTGIGCFSSLTSDIPLYLCIISFKIDELLFRRLVNRQA